MDYQQIGLIAMIFISTVFQIIAFIKGDSKSVTKLEQKRQKALDKLQKQKESLYKEEVKILIKENELKGVNKNDTNNAQEH